MQSRFDFRSPRTLYLLGLALFAVFAWLWWTQVYMGPKKVFNDMLANNFSTASVTKNEFITSNNQTNLQRVTLQLGADDVVRSLVTIRSASGSATTETIGKQGTAYVRYTDIQDAQNKRDFSQALNVWAKSGKDSGASDLPKLFSQSLLDVTAVPVPPLGYVDGDKRAELIDYVHDQRIFTATYTNAKKVQVNGRSAYEYQVAVKLAPYIRVMQEFSHVYGLTDLDSLSPSDYQSTKPVAITIAVDRLSHQMLRVSQAATGFNETYTDYGITRRFTVPTKTISTTELQQRLQAAK